MFKNNLFFRGIKSPIYRITSSGIILHNISIDIYNILGQRVNKLLDQKMPAGYHSINWSGKCDNGTLLGSGIYFIKVSTNNESYVGKVSFIK